MSDSQETEVQFIENMEEATEYQLKHTPACKVEGHPDSLIVRVKIGLNGLSHPQTEEHLIEWIAIFDGDQELDKVFFKPGQTPEFDFEIAYPYYQTIVQAYCNLHGIFGTYI
ncbi:MAG: hypothetical protein LBU61_06355 [Coriobacteriales bacterium]|jgi:desulfoferrodoxin-like iron-binding protein|nr:hypothetical protein [Coriobacteriales bacterium]